MAGKTVKRSRVQAVKFRLQKAGKSKVEKQTADTVAKPAPTAASKERDRTARKQRGTNVVQPLRRPRFPAQVTKGLRFLAAPLVWLCLLAFCGGTGVAAFLWLTTLPPVPNCQTMPSPASDSEQLYCAEQASRSGKVEALLAGLALVKNWSPDHPLRHRANRDVTEWSKSLLAIADTKAGQGDLAGAIALAKKIPASSPLHADAQTALLGWQKAQNLGQTINAAIQRALKQQDWQTATLQMQALTRLDDEYARQNLNRLRQQLVTERTTYQQLQQARQIAASAPEDVVVIGKAIALAERLPASYARSAAQLDIQTWGQFLLNRLTAQLGQADMAGAIVSAQSLPFSLPLPPVARDLLWIGRAQPLATSNLMTTPLLEQFWQLWLPLSQVRQIRADSPLAAQTKVLIPRLEQQTQDLLQLQLAQTVGRLKQLPTLQSAIALVQPITPGRPRRLYAQTLIAQWRKEIQQLEDRPYVTQAQQLAAAGTLPKLNAAIAQARQVAPGRALRLEAQNLIAKWTRQIQTLEDQPILNQARALAKQNKLTEAIQTANKIRADRALYKDAQAAANDWIAQIQIAEDQSLLDEARALADRGRLTRAISLASEISYGRALYDDAQSAIARWSDQRDTILRERRSRRDEPSSLPEPSRPSSGYNSPVEAPDSQDLPPP
ncbi:hypothetical protein H6F86_14985 [Phormidium sp. FACHB-592]|uniref:Chromosome segregation ATPase n=1 Tax=Stenomitos frigidus AS-A4 TaxID=2933935 RepID=A0ABV0KQN7_9CYAN|nr:hypothetical protein [Phormidium sp. FACHB-592]MBD2075175.1 hypothetical protein [Phormidium sp. FACHB-592]